MKFQGALIKEQGVVFGIVIVNSRVLQNNNASNAVRQFGYKVFGRVPIILMSQNSRGIPTYLGRKDIVQYLSRVPLNCIPWREYSIA